MDVPALHTDATPPLGRGTGPDEDFCVVTQSVRVAIPVAVQVFDSEGTLLASTPGA
jgi:hypothetical protein